VVYVFFTHFTAGTPGLGFHQMIKSFDGARRGASPVTSCP